MAEGTQVTSLSLNTAGEILGDVSVRQALSWATDNTAISEMVYGSLQEACILLLFCGQHQPCT